MEVLVFYAAAAVALYLIAKGYRWSEEQRRDRLEEVERLKEEVRERTLEAEAARRTPRVARRRRSAPKGVCERGAALDPARHRQLQDALEAEHRDFEARKAKLSTAEREEEKEWRDYKRITLASLHYLLQSYHYGRLTDQERGMLRTQVLGEMDQAISQIRGRTDPALRGPRATRLVPPSSRYVRRRWACRRCGRVFYEVYDNVDHRPKGSFALCLGCLEADLTAGILPNGTAQEG